MTTLNGAPAEPTKMEPGAPAPAGPAPAAPDPLAEAKRFHAEAQAKLDAAEKRARVHAAEARNFANEKKGIGAKLSEYERLTKYEAEQKRLDAQAKLNKGAFLESKFGKDWYDQIVQERLNGGAPTADTIALEVAKIEERMEAKLAARDRQRADTEQAAQQQRSQSELRDFHASAAEFATAKLADYPLFESLGTPASIGAALVQRIRAEHDRTLQRDESGAVTAPGKILTFAEAADALEEELLGIARRAVAAEKYKAKLTATPKPGSVPPVGGPQPRSTEVARRTLSNGLTAVAAGQQRTPRSDEERRKAAYEAVEELKRRA